MQQNGTSERNGERRRMTRYDLHNGVMEPIVSNIASPVPVTVPLHLDKPHRHKSRTESRQKVDRSKKSHQTIASFLKIL
jgi:hypothetical protein